MIQYPVLDVIPQLKSALSSNRIVILQAPPGAGKSTILPSQLLEEPWLGHQRIIMLEPRRLAAKSVAARMADLREEKTGDTIGYRVRFDSSVGPRTRIEVVTEGILTRMIQSDNSLGGTGLLIFDEFHERSLQADLSLALSLQVQQVLREDLRILIMSATLESEKLSSALGQVPVITSTGKQFPVAISYSTRDSTTHVSLLVAQAVRKALREETGDILAFLPGAGEIRRTEQILLEESVPASIHPLFGDLPFKQQQEAILPGKTGQRKIVLATSIAETSLTIEGVRVVVDGGFSRVPSFDPRSGLTRLETVLVTQDSADQRAGRAGRQGPGICYRLWDEGTQRNLLAQRKPEIMEADLATLVLELASWGIKQMSELTWITIPPAGAVNQAKELLVELGALDGEGITARGKEMLKLPTHPRLSHMLLMARTKEEKSIACDIAALLEERDPLPKEAGADLSLRMDVLRKWRSGEKTAADRNVLERVERLSANWRKLLHSSIDNSAASPYTAGMLLIAAYPERIARQQGKQSVYYVLSNGRVAKLPEHDPMKHEPWLVVTQLDAGQREGKIYSAGPLHEDDLVKMASEAIRVWWDEERGMVAASLEKRVGGLLLDSKPVHKIPEEEKNKILLDVIRKKRIGILGWDDSARSLQARLQSVRLWRKEEEWPDVSDEHLLKTLEEWLVPYLNTVYKIFELQKLGLKTILMGLIPWNLQSRLDAFAPVGIAVPSGSVIALQYFQDGRAPIMEVRLQEMFGLLETPTVNDGRTKVLLHLLSPGYKPVQVTQDLRSFWATTYHDVRKELRMRYPKHSWPEDPFTAVAVRGAKRKPHTR